jgi:flagellar M-ring protein FliF
MNELWTNMLVFWRGLERQRQILFGVSAALVLGLVLALSAWIFRSDYQVLFADLEERDASAIVEELKRTKIPYRIADGGRKILVEDRRVHETRLGLMGRGIPLSGGVGFEVFDNKDVGMTEYTQKINYQRALQGELARTIMAVEQVKLARVHLVVAEAGLFKRQKADPKASVNLVLRPGARLSSEQIVGIQRLVAAAVPGLNSAHVIISDQRGVTLSPMPEDDGTTVSMNSKLRLKKQVEDYLLRKVAEVLDRTYGPGQAIVSIDATLNFDEIRRTQESVVPASDSKDGATGVMVRKRQSVQRQPGSQITKAVDGDVDAALVAGQGYQTATSEVEYVVGKSVEHVVGSPGGMRRLSIGVVVPAQLDDEQIARMREMVSMVIGLSTERGDAITVQSLDRLAVRAAGAPGAAVTSASEADNADGSSTGIMSIRWWQESLKRIGLSPLLLITGVLAVVGLFVALAVWARTRRPRHEATSLSREDRERLLDEIRHWAKSQSPHGAAGAP